LVAVVLALFFRDRVSAFLDPPRTLGTAHIHCTPYVRSAEVEWTHVTCDAP
jgi:hypothetical protein